MKKGLWFTFVGGIIVLTCFYFYMHRDRARVFDGSEVVFLKSENDQFLLYKNGAPFYIKGASGNTYLKELAEAGGNTLRVYDTINLRTTLDNALKYDISVIVDIPIPAYRSNNSFYDSTENVLELKTDIKRFIKGYKDHPAVLIWNLGNELNYPLTLIENSFTKTYNELIDLIHTEDIDHPISTSVSGTSRGQTLGILLNSPKLDIIGFNAFGNIPKVEPLMNDLKLITNPKPYYIMEWGIHGPWEAPRNFWQSILETTSTEKGERYKDIYDSYIKNNTDCLGSLVFYWGHKHEGTTTWFNIFDENGRKSEAYYDIEGAWNGKIIENDVPKIEDMKVNDSLSKNLIISPKSDFTAEVILKKAIDSNLIFNWTLYKEAWGYQEWVKLDDSFIYSQNSNGNSNTVKFSVPQEDGPYRIFVNILDSKGNFATTNTPFYVLSVE